MNPKGQNICIGMFLIMLLFNKYVLYDELLYQQIYHPLKNNNVRAQRGLPRDVAQQGLQGTQQGFQMSTTRLLEKCSTAGAAKGGNEIVNKYLLDILESP
jgi:hypothetical protein